MTMGEKIKDLMIARRFNGPPSSGNGGYVSGLIGQNINGAVEVSLRLPPPLETKLELSRKNDDIILHSGETIYGIGKSAVLDLEIPSTPHDAKFENHPANVEFTPFNTCFVCGDARELGDGLCIHARPVAGLEGRVGADWILDQSLADRDGYVDPVFIWSALDCPGYAACAYGEPALLARMTAQVTGKLKCEDKAFVLGWNKGGSGRKRFCGTAVYDQDCNLIAAAEALWVVVKAEQIAV